MNPFVNPNTRSILLPNGCKNLIDVLNQTTSESSRPISKFQKFIQLVLFQSQQDGATESVIGVAKPNRGLPIKYKVKNSWHGMAPAPSHIRVGVISEIMQMAKMPAGQFPNEGVLDIILGSVRFRWTVRMTSMDAECVLVRILD